VTAITIAANPKISFTSRPWAADNAPVGARAHSEPVGRPFDVTVEQRLVPLEVVVAARDGDRDSLGRLCTLIHPRLIGFYRYSGLTASESEDLAGDVIEDVLTRLATLRSPKAFDAWMWSIGRNRLKGWIRVNRRPDRYEPSTPAASGPEERAIDADDHSRIRGALTMLSLKDRELLWLREVEGLSYEEIGGRLSAATGTIRVACHRARKKLEQAYQEEGI
jgi:RNA polymerase sigma-70 factor (ECF subfamily)